MSKKVLYLLGILTTIVIGTWLHYRLCCSSDCTETATIENDETLIIEEELSDITVDKQLGFNFKTNKSTFSCSDNFKFEHSNFEVKNPISDSIKIGISQLKTVLNDNPNISFNINGIYTSDEINNTIYPDLGIARATAIKNYLIANGIPNQQLHVFSSENNEPEIFNFATYETLEVATNTEDDNSKWTTLKAEINANPVRLYFNTGQSSINLSQSDKEKIGKIIQYINSVDGAKILITGHTDNTTGPNNTNEYYSLKRAEFAKKYLISNGINAAIILVEGKADKEPIADNNTEEGRAKNRRAEVSVK